MTIASVLGEGTAVTVRLPVLDAQSAVEDRAMLVKTGTLGDNVVAFSPRPGDWKV